MCWAPGSGAGGHLADRSGQDVTRGPDVPPSPEGHFWARPRAGGVWSDGSDCQTSIPSHSWEADGLSLGGRQRQGLAFVYMCGFFKI